MWGTGSRPRTWRCRSHPRPRAGRRSARAGGSASGPGQDGAGRARGDRAPWGRGGCRHLCHQSRHRHHSEPTFEAGFGDGRPGRLTVGWYDLEVSRVRWRAVGAPGAGLEGGLALETKARDETADPAVGDAVSAGNLTQRAAQDDDGGDDETGLRHPADPAPGPVVAGGAAPGLGVSYVLRDPVPMSWKTTPPPAPLSSQWRLVSLS